MGGLYPGFALLGLHLGAVLGVCAWGLHWSVYTVGLYLGIGTWGLYFGSALGGLHLGIRACGLRWRVCTGVRVSAHSVAGADALVTACLPVNGMHMTAWYILCRMRTLKPHTLQWIFDLGFL